jgi:hypothetical protein
MSPLAGPLFAAALVVGAAGVAKATRPDAARVALRNAGLPGRAWLVRLIGIGELAVAAYALGWGGRLGAGSIATAYVAFALFAAVVHRRSRGRASCGCFGSSGAPVGTLHVVVDLAIAAGALVAVVDPVPGIATVAADTPLAGVPFVAFTVLLALLIEVLLTAVPELQAAHRPPRGVPS